jgi:hypothetical protein
MALMVGASLSSKVLHNGRALKLTVKLDRAATIRALVSKLVAGRRSKGRCVAPTKKLRRAKKCTRAIRKRTLTAQGKELTERPPPWDWSFVAMG